MDELLYKDLTYKVIGACMEVHKTLGKGFNEIVYGDALELEFKNQQIKYSREEKFRISYKGVILPHFYKADFIIDKCIVLEIKAIKSLEDAHINQILNYLAASKLKIGLLVNFGELSLKYKRLIL